MSDEPMPNRIFAEDFPWPVGRVSIVIWLPKNGTKDQRNPTGFVWTLFHNAPEKSQWGSFTIPDEATSCNIDAVAEPIRVQAQQQAFEGVADLRTAKGFPPPSVPPELDEVETDAEAELKRFVLGEGCCEVVRRLHDWTGEHTEEDWRTGHQPLRDWISTQLPKDPDPIVIEWTDNGGSDVIG